MVVVPAGSGSTGSGSAASGATQAGIVNEIMDCRWGTLCTPITGNPQWKKENHEHTTTFEVQECVLVVVDALVMRDPTTYRPEHFLTLLRQIFTVALQATTTD